MALAIDSQETSNAGHREIGGANLTWAFNNVAGNLLVVGVVITNATTPYIVSSVTYNTISMGSPVVSIGWASNNSVVYLFALASPATGSNNVVVTPSDTAACLLAGAISFSGADTATPTGTTSTNTDAGGTGTHATAGNITAASGNYIVGVGGYGNNVAPTGDQTITFSLIGTGNTAGDNIAAVQAQSSGAAINAGFTWTGADHWGMVAAEIMAAGGSPQPDPATVRVITSPRLV